MEVVFISVLTTPGWIAAKMNPSSGVTSDAQLSVTAATQCYLLCSAVFRAGVRLTQTPEPSLPCLNAALLSKLFSSHDLTVHMYKEANHILAEHCKSANYMQ